MSYNKWYFDELYDAIFVNPVKALGRFLWKKGDGADRRRVAVDGICLAHGRASPSAPARCNPGYVYHYAFVMLIGIVAMVSWYIFAFGK